LQLSLEGLSSLYEIVAIQPMLLKKRSIADSDEVARAFRD
jgi:hypothetical protein